MRLRRSYIFCFVTFVIFDVLQAKSLSYNILLNKPFASRDDMNKITTSERLNNNNQPNRQLHNNCVELSDNILCMIYNKEKSTGLKNQILHPEDFVDITRLKDNLRFLTGITRTNSKVDKFSEDYLDIGDLATRKEANIFDNPNKLYSKLKSLIASFQPKNVITSKIERSRKVNVADLINFIDFRSHDTDTSEESMEKHKKRKKPKRFEVVENSDESSAPGDTDSETSNEMSIPLRNKNSKVIYVQGPTRHILSDERRSRIPYFMPKRYHWDLNDIKDLPYFWFNGPQGYFSGVYKIFI